MTDANESAQHVKSGCATSASSSGPRRVPKINLGSRSTQISERILAGDRFALAKAITLIESSRAADRECADQVIEGCLPISGKSIRVGVTGAPGAGKSCLIEAIGKHLITERHEKVAVLAIDPSSHISGGSILGDKTRMNLLASSEMAFIRPSPSRGAYGGVAQNTRDAILLCEAAGYQNILVETVGVGQSETAVSEMVDFVLLVTLPGAGDELQGIKRGVMEIAHLVVVNKADGDNIRRAELARTEIETALHLLPKAAQGWMTRAISCSAHTGFAVPEVWSCVLTFHAMTRANGHFEGTRHEQARRSMRESVEQGLLRMFRSDPAVRHRQSELEQEVLAGTTTIGRAAHDLLALFASKSRSTDCG